ncbi:Os08g0255020 [Oryza sativa Japonica Group]|uniref:Os08g0255020 protein n=1 Tax=Oryza sativa subsp. japonica TaxID=39947 RepID=A0A0P0XDL0_ORYSJ|nr:Os08g0255020 [Oryza sativa Japonica Group]
MVVHHPRDGLLQLGAEEVATHDEAHAERTEGGSSVVVQLLPRHLPRRLRPPSSTPRPPPAAASTPSGRSCLRPRATAASSAHREREREREAEKRYLSATP